MTTRLPVAIVDPMLGDVRTWDLGPLASFLEEDADCGGLRAWCGTGIDAQVRARLADAGLVVEPVFTSGEGADNHPGQGVAERWDWIRDLIPDYRRALEQALAQWPDTPILVVHHGISWEHATALSLAIRLLGEPGRRLRHVVVGMPWLDADVLANTSSLNVRLAFRALHELINVDLFASGQEQALAYAALLQSAPLPVHPWLTAHPGAGHPPGAPALAVPGDERDLRARHRVFREWLEGLSSGKPVSVQRDGPVAIVDIAARISAARATRPSPAEAQGQGADVVLFWKQNDSTLYGRRSDMVAKYLASRDDVRRVLVVDAPIGEDAVARMIASHQDIRHDRRIAERVFEKLSGQCDDGKLSHAVFVHSPGNDAEQPDARFLEDYACFLAAEFERLGMDRRRLVFWVYPKNYGMPYLLGRFGPARLVVDVVDDHRKWPGVSDAEVVRLTGNYRQLLERADLALANCEPVQLAMRPYCEGIRLVPNGCDEPRLPAEHAEDPFPGFTGRIIGYVGNLESKVDIPLLARVAERFPDCLVVLVGSTHANFAALELLRHPNVRMPGVVPYDRLGNWLTRFDVGLIPHTDVELTRHMNPLKAYVYLSSGVPVVATTVANLAPATGLIRVADSHETFLDAVAGVLAQGKPPRDRFRAFADANGWSARLSRHVDDLGLGLLERSDRPRSAGMA